MKPASIIFLVFALVLFIFGSILCSSAISQAQAQNIEVFDYQVDDNGNVISRIEFSEENITKIVISASKCNVNIYGNSAETYAELINFEKNKYTLSTNGSCFNFSDSMSWKSFIQLSSNGLSFDGLRYILPGSDSHKPKVNEDAERTVNIYLSAAETVKQFDVAVAEGNITLANIQTTADIILKTEQGIISASGLPNLASFKAEAKKGDILLSIEAPSANIDLLSSEGNIKMWLPSTPTGKVNISAGSSLSYFGEQILNAIVSEPENPVNTITAIATAGSITVETIQPQQ